MHLVFLEVAPIGDKIAENNKRSSAASQHENRDFLWPTNTQ